MRELAGSWVTKRWLIEHRLVHEHYSLFFKIKLAIAVAAAAVGERRDDETRCGNGRSNASRGVDDEVNISKVP